MVIVLGDDKEAPIVDRKLCKSFTLPLLVLTLVELTSFYRSQTKLREGNVFTPVYQSFCSQRGIFQHAMDMGCTPPRQTPPWADTPIPSADTPQVNTPPSDGHWGGRYASYWNAFLFTFIFKQSILTIEFFTVNTKLVEMTVLASKDLTNVKKLPPVGLDLMQEIITGLRVKRLSNWANLA